MDWGALITPAYLTVLFGIVGWLLKGKLDRIERRMDCFEKSQHACQISNAKDFATWEAHGKLDGRVDDHERRISTLEGARG
jgi:hypothetical protein